MGFTLPNKYPPPIPYQYEILITYISRSYCNRITDPVLTADDIEIDQLSVNIIIKPEGKPIKKCEDSTTVGSGAGTLLV